jgi:putative peptidoglycan lipid II flippase
MLETESAFGKVASQWRRWKDASTHRKIFGAALVILILDMATRLCSVPKELAVAFYFGTGDALDSFLVAFMIPSFLMNVLGGAFRASVIPTYIQVRDQQGKKEAQALLSGTLFLSCVTMMAVLGLLCLLIPVLLPQVARGFSPEKLELTRRLFYLLLPSVLISGLSIILGSILNAGEKFVLATASGAAIPVSILFFLLTRGGGGWGIYALAIGTLFGFVLEFCLIATGVKKQGISLTPRFTGFTPEIRQVMMQYVSIFAGAFLMGSTLLVDQVMAAMLPAGSVSALNYANKVVALPLSLTVTALGTAVVPYFSKLSAQGQWPEIRSVVKYYLTLIFLGGSAVAVVLILFSGIIVRLLFERGSFTGHDTQLVAQILRCYALQVPFYVGGVLIVRLISSSRANHILFWGALINVVVNIVLNYILMMYLGVAGIALSTSVVYLVSFSFVFYHYRSLSGGYETHRE